VDADGLKGELADPAPEEEVLDVPAGIGLVLQSTGVSSLGICLSVLAVVSGGIHIAARGR
jgi:hypothetical protein